MKIIIADTKILIFGLIIGASRNLYLFGNVKKEKKFFSSELQTQKIKKNSTHCFHLII